MPCAKARELDLDAFVVEPRAAEWAAFRDHYPLCADCSREVARLGVLVGALRLEGTASAHPGERQLVAFSTSSEQLRPEEREAVAAHLAGCAPCRTELAVLERFDWPALAAAPERPSWRERLGAALFPGLPRPLLAAALLVLIAAPAIFVWRALSDRDRAGGGDRLARIEAQPVTPPAPVEVPKQPERAPPEEPPASPEPIEVAKPPEPERAPEKLQAPAPKAAEPKPAEARPAEAKPPQPEHEPRPVQIAALLPAEAPSYVPGALAAGASVRVGGTSRSAGPDVPVPQVLAPAHVGATSRQSPTLYWFLPAATPLSAELTIVEPNEADPLLEVVLPGPLAAGIHAVHLAERGARLAPGVDYPWFVALVQDPERRARDVVSGGSIRYAPGSTVATSPPARLAHAYAEAGLWYDAFEQLSTWLEAEPGAAVLHQHRAALLDQVGLDEAARYERAAASARP